MGEAEEEEEDEEVVGAGSCDVWSPSFESFVSSSGSLVSSLAFCCSRYFCISSVSHPNSSRSCLRAALYAETTSVLRESDVMLGVSEEAVTLGVPPLPFPIPKYFEKTEDFLFCVTLGASALGDCDGEELIFFLSIIFFFFFFFFFFLQVLLFG